MNNFIKLFSRSTCTLSLRDSLLMTQRFYKQDMHQASLMWVNYKWYIPTNTFACRYLCSSGLTKKYDSNKDQGDEKSQQEVDSCVKIVKVVPGKGPPPEPPLECCMTGCPNCVWLIYAEELKKYYSDNGKAAKDAIEKIENPSLKAFLKFEMNL